MTVPIARLFLVAPLRDAATIRACLEAACEVGDVASLLLPASCGKETLSMAQALGVAVVIDGDAARAAKLGADGVQIDASVELYGEARRMLGRQASIGAYCAGSRHAAMQMAEAGADYLAIAQTAPSAGEPLIAWCADMLEVPCVAFDPAEPDELAALHSQRPDFIRPSERMWQSPDAAREVVATAMLAIRDSVP